MEIKTKLKPGDIVFTIHESEIKQMTIHDIEVFLNSKFELIIMYNLNFKKRLHNLYGDRSWYFEAYHVLEQNVHKTKEDLINSL